MRGSINVQSQNIFPIIKKFLYSDQEIFLRELVANAIDATTKIKTLASRGEFNGALGNTQIEIILDEAAKTLTVRDRGLGLTEDEAKRYLSEVAFSSAAEFLQKFEGEANIIGHFGLGFYSAFMVADRVEVFSKSYKDEPGVRWACSGEPEYEAEVWADKTERGTDVVLHISEDAVEYLEKSKIQGLLDKYCRFLPVEIVFGTRTETNWEEGEGEDAEKKSVNVEVPNIINNPNPLWKKSPSELKDEDYKNFYQELYPMSDEPSFWVHLNIDYPFNLTGVLYFPKLKNNFEAPKNHISLYCNQVYVTDDVRAIVPEFLNLLHGIIDSPDIPLNVSRSSLQSDKNVKQITQYITRKVADKLDEMFRKDRETFEQKWNGIGVFVKYGMLTEDKFNEKAKKFVLLENLDGKYFTTEEYREKVQATQTDKDGKVIFLYTHDVEEHDTYIKNAQAQGMDVLLLNTPLDSHWMQKIESDMDKVSFARVDADTLDNLIKKETVRESVMSESDQKVVEELFKGQMADQFGQVKLSPLSPTEAPVLITKPEWMRRMKEMQMLGGGGGFMGNFPDSYNVVVNSNHPLVANALTDAATDEGRKKDLAKHLFDLARLQQGMLKGAELTAFVERNLALMK